MGRIRKQQWAFLVPVPARQALHRAAIEAPIAAWLLKETLESAFSRCHSEFALDAARPSEQGVYPGEGCGVSAHEKDEAGQHRRDAAGLHATLWCVGEGKHE